jgi:hypothetical protein
MQPGHHFALIISICETGRHLATAACLESVQLPTMVTVAVDRTMIPTTTNPNIMSFPVGPVTGSPDISPAGAGGDGFNTRCGCHRGGDHHRHGHPNGDAEVDSGVGRYSGRTDKCGQDERFIFHSYFSFVLHLKPVARRKVDPAAWAKRERRCPVPARTTRLCIPPPSSGIPPPASAASGNFGGLSRSDFNFAR